MEEIIQSEQCSLCSVLPSDISTTFSDKPTEVLTVYMHKPQRVNSEREDQGGECWGALGDLSSSSCTSIRKRYVTKLT